LDVGPHAQLKVWWYCSFSEHGTNITEAIKTTSSKFWSIAW